MLNSGSYWKLSDGTTIRDLGYRNSIYILQVGGKIYKFPTDNEAYEFIDNMLNEDSGE